MEDIIPKKSTSGLQLVLHRWITNMCCVKQTFKEIGIGEDSGKNNVELLNDKNNQKISTEMVLQEYLNLVG